MSGKQKKIYAGFRCSSDISRKLLSPEITGADGFIFTDSSKTDAEHDLFTGKMREWSALTDKPVITYGKISRLEDVKKYIYAGSDGVLFDVSPENGRKVIREAAERFGKNRICVRINSRDEIAEIPELMREGASEFFFDAENVPVNEISVPEGFEGERLWITDPSTESVSHCLENPACSGVVIFQDEQLTDFSALKKEMKERKIPVHAPEAAFAWEDVKKGPDDLLPVVVQDYRSLEVLMVAYMNEESYRMTVETGRMTYWSRSRRKLWVKGETSGHIQFVRSLTLDCDKDTLLAKVLQIGPACHTGARSCFFNDVLNENAKEGNPGTVFEDVYRVIQDRKEHPREGSYTNYLFDKGIDKILKKVGEEATEIVIAAKNPNPDEIRYEISDFMYHVMVLMAEKNVTWKDITEELIRRESGEGGQRSDK